MKTKKPRILRNPIEYRLLVTPEYDELQQRQLLLVCIRTIKEFSSFRYELAVTDTLDGATLKLNIVGLRAPKTNIPRIGFAMFEKLYEQPASIKKIVILKMDKKENSFTLRTTKLRTIVKELPERPFIEIVTSKQDW